MKRIILTYTLAFSLLSAYAGEGGSPPLEKTRSLQEMLEAKFDELFGTIEDED